MDDLKQRLRAATEGVMPGPWRLVDAGGGDYYIWSGDDMAMYFDAYQPSCFWGEAGWNFVCTARTLIPEAAAALDALEAENARLRALLSDLADAFEYEASRGGDFPEQYAWPEYRAARAALEGKE